MIEPITITEAAANAISERINDATGKVIGLRLNVKPTGCSGNSYAMEYVSESDDVRQDDQFTKDNAILFIPKTVSWMLFGIEIDYGVDDLGNESFIFNNPNEVDRCGCGESFRVR